MSSAAPPELPPGSRQVAKGAGTALLARAGGVIEIVSQPLYVWLFGLPTYGLYMVLWSAVNLIENIADMGMTSALQRVVPQARDDAERAAALRQAMLLGLGPCILIALLVSLGAHRIAEVVNVAAKDRDELATGIAIFAWALPFWAYVEIATSALRARKAFGPEIRLRVMWEQILRMIAATLLAALGAGTLGLLIAHLCSLAITCVFSTRLLARYYRLDLVLRGAGPSMRAKTFYAGISVLPSNIVNRLFSDAPPLILNLIIPGAAGASAAGLFAIARKIASGVQLIRQAFSYVMAPLASEAVRHDIRHVAEIYGFATRLTIVVATPVVCTIAGGGRALLALFGSGAQAAYLALALLTFTRLIEAVAGQASAIQSVISRYHHPLVGSAIGLAVSLALGALLLPQGGMDGMAIAVSAGIAVSVLTPMVQLWHHQHLHPFAPPFARAAAVAAAVGAVIFLLSELLGPLHHVVRIAIGAVLLVAGIWVSGRFGLSHDDKLALGKTARKLRLL
ncbi:lipopolysaccharide biosynthesis protein [Rhizorhabdus wittichii]|jgi:O-antigen/teichoic acid export membrane protein|uniref:Polysaccharide biosynthesis protein n=2 Tax=Rhizorhabdus wittichii TaxID=160791 RepID=A0A9J9LDB6_RHIWR|nr:oligosaccharide flippase family protein [Rhizorhabdus wittichii]ABQ67670.1 polysaccharide biosynthesis protein [Rhizorhabdus wittichii RW1]ARR55567.1 polysaccharide biosynthesis protein [Rhizorhabdus wittichii DC-6]QTH21870.1 oligosaccharide flippase family protein [Rhizorhabdus wittichii]